MRARFSRSELYGFARFFRVPRCLEYARVVSQIRRWLTYVPRFFRHYRHRRQGGYSLEHALSSTRARMREPDA